MQKMYKIIALSLALLMSFSIVACSGSTKTATSTSAKSSAVTNSSANPTSAPMTVTKIKFSSSGGELSTVHQGALKFQELLSKASKGRYEVVIYPNSQLASGNQQAAVEMLQNGDIDIAFFGMTMLSFLDDRLAVVNLPFLFNSYEDADKILFNGEGTKALNVVLKEKGMIGLSYGEAGFRQITNSKREIHAPADFKGLKFRVLSTCPMFFDVFGALGANPTAINIGEVFTSLQQGVVDGQENGVDTTRSFKFNEVQKYITCWNGIYDALPLVASPKFMDKLSSEDKALVLDCAKQAMEYQRQTNRNKEKSILDEFAKTMTITYLKDEEKAAFKQVLQPVYDKWKGKLGNNVLSAFGIK